MSTADHSNVIILTHGWTGSSVYAGLFGQIGFWLGSETMKKVDYNTNENSALISINQDLIDRLLPNVNYEHRFSPADVRQVADRARDADLAPLKQFLTVCDSRQPWLWKDPRLTWTIRTWAKVLDLDRVKFLVLTRDSDQAWISSNLRRHVQSREFTEAYKSGITQSNLDFLAEHQLPVLSLSFENLLLTPEATLERLNGFFGTAMTMAALHKIYRHPLYKKNHGLKDYFTALAIYLKNYAERDGRGRQMQKA